MMIQVQYTDGRHDMVKPQLLDRLLDAHKIFGFRRGGGWATVGRDPLRRQRGSRLGDFNGEERRDAAG